VSFNIGIENYQKGEKKEGMNLIDMDSIETKMVEIYKISTDENCFKTSCQFDIIKV